MKLFFIVLLSSLLSSVPVFAEDSSSNWSLNSILVNIAITLVIWALLMTIITTFRKNKNPSQKKKKKKKKKKTTKVKRDEPISKERQERLDRLRGKK